MKCAFINQITDKSEVVTQFVGYNKLCHFSFENVLSTVLFAFLSYCCQPDACISTAGALALGAPLLGLQPSLSVPSTQ